LTQHHSSNNANVDCSAEAITRKFHRANKVFYNGFLNKQDKYASFPEFQAHAAELLHFLKSLWVTNTLCDLQIIIGNKKYYAHRLGLAMFSKKYRDEFQRQLELKEANIYTICLKNSSNFALEAILKYIYTAKVDINPANVEEILAAAKELGIDDLICMASDYLNSLSIGDVLDFMGNIFNKEGSSLMLYELYSYMMNHLDKVTRTPEYYKASICTIRALLNDSHLNVCNELEVFDAAIRWLEFDKPSRLKCVGELMKSVRFTLIQPDDLISKVECVNYVCENREAHKMIYNSFKYHSLCKSNFTNLIKREEPRCLSLKGASVPEDFIKAVKELSGIARDININKRSININKR
jgi:hypothetical protein